MSHDPLVAEMEAILSRHRFVCPETRALFERAIEIQRDASQAEVTPTSDCCGARPLGECVSGQGLCQDCRDHAQFDPIA